MPIVQHADSTAGVHILNHTGERRTHGHTQVCTSPNSQGPTEDPSLMPKLILKPLRMLLFRLKQKVKAIAASNAHQFDPNDNPSLFSDSELSPHPELALLIP